MPEKRRGKDVVDVTRQNNTLSVKAYRGDAKTLLAFNLGKAQAKRLAGFTVQCQPDGQPPYYIYNSLQFKDPSTHAQDGKEPPVSSINAPIHKFRWVHVPGTVHQGTKPCLGSYTYTVTPRYFDDNESLQPLDPKLSVSVPIAVDGFEKKGVQLGFTRGYTQSQAFVHHFGLKALIQPKAKQLQFDTSQESGVNAAGEHFTFAEEYEWLGFTARAKIFSTLTEVLENERLRVDVFAYDLNEPDFIAILLKLAKDKRVRIILDNAALHHNSSKPTAEDQFEKLFNKAAGKAELIKRGKFGRYAHDKVLVVRNQPRNSGPRKSSDAEYSGEAQTVLTGSTNFSVTGLYVNSNHVLVFKDPKVTAAYASVFDEAWKDDVKRADFAQSAWATKPYTFSSAQTPKTIITFSPHNPKYASSLMQAVVNRIQAEGKKSKAVGSVLFAVMQIDGTGKAKKSGQTTGSAMNKTNNAVYQALNALHSDQRIFSGVRDRT
jgi:PLD-like domain